MSLTKRMQVNLLWQHCENKKFCHINLNILIRLLTFFFSYSTLFEHSLFFYFGFFRFVSSTIFVSWSISKTNAKIPFYFLNWFRVRPSLKCFFLHFVYSFLKCVRRPIFHMTTSLLQFAFRSYRILCFAGLWNSILHHFRCFFFPERLDIPEAKGWCLHLSFLDFASTWPSASAAGLD